MVSKREAEEVLKTLLNEGFRFTLIGGTIVELELGSKDLGDDLDLFAEKPDVFVEENLYREVASKYDWSIGQTWLGTPRILARVEGVEVPIEFYDNIYDFYVPQDMIERAIRRSLGGVRIKALILEDHIVLKANAGREKDLERLKEIAKYVKRGRLKIDKRKILEASNLFEESGVILRRLRDSGLPV